MKNTSLLLPTLLLIFVLMGCNEKTPNETQLAENQILEPTLFQNLGEADHQVFTLLPEKTGNTVWKELYGGSSNENLESAFRLPGGDFVLGGTSLSSNGDVGQAFGFLDHWVIRIQPDGTLVWSRVLGDSDVNPTKDIAQGQGNSIVGYGYEHTNGTSADVANPASTITTTVNPPAPCSTPPPLCTENLILNPGFESGVLHWTTQNVVQGDTPRTGTQSVKICTSDGSLTQGFPATPGQEYTASLWAFIHTANTGASYATLRFLTSSWQPIPTNQYFITSVGTYEQIVMMETAPPNAAFVQVLLWKEPGGCLETDDWELCESSAPPPCEINTILQNKICDDNGTPNDDTDDIYTFEIFVTGTNTGNNGWTASFAGNTVTGSYGTAVQAGPLNISAGNVDIFISDVDDPSCSQLGLVVPPAPCSGSQTCEIVTQFLSTNCFDNGTPNDPSDDEWSFSIDVNSNGNGCSNFFNDGFANIAYGSAITVGEFPISSGPQSITLTDSADPTVQTTVTVNPPLPCSGNCNIQVTDAPSICNDNGTPNDPTDDFFFSELTVINPGSSSTGYSINFGGQIFNGTYGQVLSMGPFPTDGMTIPFVITDNNDPDCNINGGNTGQFPCSNGDGIDLELGLAQPNASPPQWSSYSVIATLTNAGGQDATGVKVSFPKPAGVVYTGGNEFTASQGTFDVFGSQEWNVGSLANGETATLEVSYFLLASESPVAYAQVSAANEQDADSTPGNGTPPTPNEDDEASTDGGTAPLPDLVLADLDILNSPVTAGQILNYEFDASNQGAGAASGNFNIKTWISVDNAISADDIQDGIVPTGNYGAGLTVVDIAGASTIPASLADGQYFLILKVDAENDISESNEGNNLLSGTFTVGDPAPDEADLELTMTLSDTTLTVGQTLTATATLTNQGPSTATNIVVSTSLAGFPGFFENILASPSVGTFTPFTGAWNIPSLAAGTSATITISAAPNAVPMTGGQAVVFFQVDGVDQPDPDSTPDNDDQTEDDLVLQLISVEPSPGDIDLSLSMSANPENPPIYTTTAVTLTVTNSGSQTANGVIIDFPRPASTVYTGGNEWNATQGSFNPFGNEQWNVGSLAAGESAILTVNYFLLTGYPLTPYAQVIAAAEQDVDSTPNNGTCCTPNEDDEATIGLNTFNGGNNAFATPKVTGRPIQLRALRPNPVYHGQLTVTILSAVEGEYDLEIFDLMGKKNMMTEVELRKGWNDILLDVTDLASGTYYLNMPGQNWRNMPLRFVVARW